MAKHSKYSRKRGHDWKSIGLIAALAVAVVWMALVPAGRAAQGQTGAANANAGSEVVRTTLKNGLEVVVVRNTLAPVVSTVVNYKVGANETPEGFPGMAHAQEHMMFRGSPGLTAQQLADISAAMGGNFNADTQQTVTQYFFTVPADEVDVALHIQAIRMKGVLDSESEWAKERGAIEQEVAADLSNPVYVFYTKLLDAMFHGTPYAHDPLGSRPSFDKTTAKMLHDFYDNWYAPNNAILVVAGDVDPQAVLTQVTNLFGNIPSKKLPERPAVDLKPVTSSSLNLSTDLPYGMVWACFRLPGYNDPDFAAAEVLSDVLSSQRGSFYALVPQGKALFAEFPIDGLPSSGLGYAIAGFPKGADSAALLSQMKKIIEDDVKNGVPADLVEAAKRREAAQVEFQKNSISGLAMQWSQAVAVEGRQSPQDDVDAIAKVTVNDVNRVARKYLSFGHAYTAILTPEPSGKPVSHSSFGGSESFSPGKVTATALPSWAKNALSRLVVPNSTVHPVVSTLPNGIKLVVQPESVSNTVSVYGEVKNNSDMEVPADQEGVSDILDDLFSYGTQSLNRIAFQKALDDIAANESAGTNFRISVLADHFDRGVQLLADNVLHPALPEPAFKTVQRQDAAAIAGQLQSPGYLTHRAIEAALYPKGDPSLREATPKSAMSLTLDQVRNYYGRVFRPDLTTIVVIGKVTPQEARSVIEKYFGSWKAAGAAPPTDLPAVPPSKSSSTTVPDRSRVQDSVTLTESIPMNRFSSDYYALELGNHVLGGGFYATRLYQDLREKAGLVYYVGVSLNAGRTRAVYSVVYGCDPPNVSKARTMILRDLRQMQTENVDAAGLRQAKALLLREIPLRESSVGSIARGLISRSLTGLPLDEPTVAARRYFNLTAPDVKAAFAKRIRPNDFSMVVQGPTPQ